MCENWGDSCEEDRESVARLFPEIIYVLANLYQGQRTQVFAEVTVGEFRQGQNTEHGRFVEHQGGKTQGS